MNHAEVASDATGLRQFSLRQLRALRQRVAVQLRYAGGDERVELRERVEEIDAAMRHIEERRSRTQ